MTTRALRTAGAALVLVGAGLSATGAIAAEPVQTLRMARIEAIVDGRPEAPRDVVLPLHWDLAFEGRSGSAVFTLPFELDASVAEAREPYALFISRLGSAYEIEVNGALLAGAGSLVEGDGDHWSAKHPVTVNVPSRLLGSNNRLVVRIRTEAGYRGGLAPVLVGPARLLAPIAEHERFVRITLPQAISVFSVLVAVFCALLWWQQRDPLYAWAGIGEALWALTVADTVVEAQPLPWPYWGLCLLLLRAAWAWSLYAIAREVCGRGSRAEFWIMLVVQATAPLCVLAMVAMHSTRPLLGWYLVNFSVWAFVVARLLRSAWRAPTPEGVLMPLAVVAVLAASMRDVVAGRLDAALYDESAWAKYVATLVGATVMFVVSRRFLQARSEATRLAGSLAVQVEAKERELRSSFERLSRAERAQATLAERERILRDMHDGVGSNLATAVRQLESGLASREQVVQTLRESMDHLKLSIDAMTLPPGDVNALLASLRYRLQPRIESAGLRVEWDVDVLPCWQAGHDESMRNLQFLLLEIVSNVLQHADASTLRLSAHAAGDGIRIDVVDDGKGIDLAAGGMRSLQARATAIGAGLGIDRGSPGTRVSIVLDGCVVPTAATA